MIDAAMTSAPGYDRLENNAYITPAWCTECLVRNVKFKGGIWEPAAGDGRMGNVLKDAGNFVFMTDIAPLSGSVLCMDFYSPNGLFGTENIVTNPPYNNETPQFIKRALDMTKPGGGKVAMFLRNEYDSAKTRHNLFKNCAAFDLKLIMTRRPKWFADDKASPRHNYAWYVWNWSRSPGPAHIKWDQ